MTGLSRISKDIKRLYYLNPLTLTQYLRLTISFTHNLSNRFLNAFVESVLTTDNDIPFQSFTTRFEKTFIAFYALRMGMPCLQTCFIIHVLDTWNAFSCIDRTFFDRICVSDLETLSVSENQTILNYIQETGRL